MEFVRPEAELMVQCARTFIEPERAECISHLLQKPLDWDYLIKQSYRHRLLPLVTFQLNAIAPESVPAASMQAMREYQQGITGENLSLAGELIKLLRLFEQSELPVIPLKGPVLAQLVYKGLALREYFDLDVLVRPADLERVKALLIDNGYYRRRAQTDEERAHLQPNCYNLSYRTPDGKADLEIHWALADDYFTGISDSERFWCCAHSVSFMQQSVLVPSNEDLLLYLCGHGYRHRWTQLSWVGDVAEVIGAAPNLDWDSVFEQMRVRWIRRWR